VLPIVLPEDILLPVSDYLMPRRSSEPLPDFIEPQLAPLVEGAPEGDQWLHEIKIDGYRVRARIEHGKVRMLTRHANDWTARFRPIAGVLSDLKVRTAYLDGEIAVLTPEGISDFGALQEALSAIKVRAKWRADCVERRGLRYRASYARTGERVAVERAAPTPAKRAFIGADNRVSSRPRPRRRARL